MESTGVSWQPVYKRCENLFTVLGANAQHSNAQHSNAQHSKAQHSKAVPGRKADVRAAEWIATLPRHGLLRARCVPPRPQQGVREGPR